jgi:bifunctional non-homologous end joining protein LigD
MLAKPGRLPSDDRGWAYEFKWDGVRAIVHVGDVGVQAFSRNDKDLAFGFPELADLRDAVGGRSVVLDGELVAFDDAGRPSFGRLQHRLNLTSPTVVARRAGEVAASYLIFDILWLDSRSLLDSPYDERRDRLEELALNGASFATPAAFRDAHGADVLAAATTASLEGVMAKRRDSTYRPGERSSAWLKIKIVKTQEVVIGGWTDGEGERAGSLGALLLGVNESGSLHYSGKVGTGFDAAARRELLATLEPLRRDSSPFGEGTGPKPAPGVHFVEPTVVGEVSFVEWTTAGHLRHTAWRGLRIDKAPQDVVREPTVAAT